MVSETTNRTSDFKIKYAKLSDTLFSLHNNQNVNDHTIFDANHRKLYVKRKNCITTFFWHLSAMHLHWLSLDTRHTVF